MGKLIRDRIPEIIRANAEVPVVRTFTAVQYQVALRDKLLEECQEARFATPRDLAGELADVLEVMQAIATSADLAWDEVLHAQTAKRHQRGGFDERVWLEGLAEPASDER